MKTFEDFHYHAGKRNIKLLSSEQLEFCSRHIPRKYKWEVSDEGFIFFKHEVQLSFDNLTLYGGGDVSVRLFDKFPVQFAELKGSFSCEHNPLKTLKGVPFSVTGSFYCGWNELESLEHSPRYVGGRFSCRDNSKLTSLKGAPDEVVEDFSCIRCSSLKTLEGLPRKFKELICDEASLSPEEKEFIDNQKLQAEWKTSPLDWQKFIYTSGAAKGRKYGL